MATSTVDHSLRIRYVDPVTCTHDGAKGGTVRESEETNGGDRQRSDRRIDRRRFLQLGGAGTLAVAGSNRSDVLDVPGLLTAAGHAPTAPAPVPDHSVVLRRREDQLHLRLDFWNLQLVTTGTPRLERILGRPPCIVVVHFQPQHVMEEAFYLLTPTVDEDEMDDGLDPPALPGPTTNDPFDPPPVGHRVAGGSRLAFTVPDEALPVPYTWDKLLRWEAWTPRVVPAARASNLVEPIRHGSFVPPALRPPSLTETAIELPWWLLISPHRQTAWVHVDQPITRDGRTEIWHTRYAGRAPGGAPDERDAARKTIRAIWARDPKIAEYVSDPEATIPDGESFADQPLGMPFRTALSPRDRADLVTSTADFAHLKSKHPYVPQPVAVEDLTLSSGGAWLDAAGYWRAGVEGSNVSGTSLEAWRHRTSDGRDQYVRVVRKGSCFPIPFPGSLFKVTERTFRTVGSGTRGDPKRRIAYMVQRYFIVIRRREILLGGHTQQWEGVRFPFERLRARTLVTPTIDPPKGVAGFGNTMAFVVSVGEQPYLFDLEGYDRADRPIDLATPLLFVDATISSNPTDMGDLSTWYNGEFAEDSFRTIQLAGQTVAVAEPATPGDTDLDLHRFTLGAEPPLVEVTGEPSFFPTMARTEVRLAAAEAALGAAVSTETGDLPVMTYAQQFYENNGFQTAARPGEVFVELVDPTKPALLGFTAADAGDRSGGLLVPDVGVRGISRKFGVVGGDPAEFDVGKVVPSDYFGAMPATLLGNVNLADVIAETNLLTHPDAAERLMQLRTTTTPDALVTEVRWRPVLQNAGPFIASRPGADATLELVATITAPKAAQAEPTTVVRGDLRNFTLALLEGGEDAKLIGIEFDRLRFRSESGSKPDVDVEIRQVEFHNELAFINDLRDYLDFSAGGFSIDVQPTQLLAGFTLPIPSIPLGIFSLQNIAFAAGVTVPFTGMPVRFRFGFCTADDPFLVSVMIFGGGGFFELGIGADGVESFQASLEFGIVGALDFGVASGSVSVTAGIYLGIGINTPQNPQGKPELTGFIKIKGEVEVLGIVSLGIFMKAGFTYIPKKAIVRATIIVEVDVLMFSAEVEIEYEKKFGGSEDPTFGQSLDPVQWKSYRAAFAPIGA